MVSLLQKKKEKKEKERKDEEKEIVGSLEGAVSRLIQPFAQPKASRLLRTALVHAFLVLLRTVANSPHKHWDDEALVPLVPQLALGMLGSGTKLFTTVPEIVHARECTRYIIRCGVAPVRPWPPC